MSVRRSPDTGAGAAQPAGADLRALIVRVGAMGDVLHALPAVFALRAACSHAHLGWVIEPRWLPLLSSEPTPAEAGVRGPRTPLVDCCFLANTSLWKRRAFSAATVKDLRRLAQKMRSEHFDTCVDLQGSLRSAGISRLSGAARRVGSVQPRERPAKLLYTERIATPARHVVVQGCELVGAAFGMHLQPAPVELPHDPETEQWANALLPEQERVVLLAPTAGWGAKEWPPSRFAAVARELAYAGCRVLVNAASAHDPVAHQVVHASGGQCQIVACSLSQLIALIRRSHLVLAGDTGPLHLAAALGVPVVGLYGPTDPERTGPWGTRSRVFRDPASVTDHKRHRTTEAGLLHIEVNQVVEAAQELLLHE